MGVVKVAVMYEVAVRVWLSPEDEPMVETLLVGMEPMRPESRQADAGGTLVEVPAWEMPIAHRAALYVREKIGADGLGLHRLFKCDPEKYWQIGGIVRMSRVGGEWIAKIRAERAEVPEGYAHEVLRLS